MLLALRKSQDEPLTLLQGMCQGLTRLTIWPSLGPSDWTNLTPHPEMGVVVVVVAEVVVEVAEAVAVERCHHLDPEE